MKFIFRRTPPRRRSRLGLSMDPIFDYEKPDAYRLEGIQRENAHFAANVLGARGPLLSVLVHFFERGRWGSPVETTVG
jgi:hypothetical protein